MGFRKYSTPEAKIETENEPKGIQAEGAYKEEFGEWTLQGAAEVVHEDPED